MIDFKILKKSKISRARLGLLKTNHGVIETPCLVPVATQAVVKTLTSEEVIATKSKVLIANTFHLHLKPGEKIVKKAGGLHRFMNWPYPLMTDSGGFQVFSLGFGKDLGIGKILKHFPTNETKVIRGTAQPKSVKITSDGVYFQSPLDGKKLFLGPKESIKIQEELGADIIFAFDECPSPLASPQYIKDSLKRTHSWAKICLGVKKSEQAPLEVNSLKKKYRENKPLTGQALFGIVQGGRYKELRIESAKFIGNLPFDGFGIGGEFGNEKKKMEQMLCWTLNELPEEKPRHLLGIGHFEDIENIIEGGIDLFDCTVPTHYARRGIAFVSSGRLNLRQSKFLKDQKSLDSRCTCSVCQNYKRNYISHLVRVGEITGLKLLTFHNLYFFNSFVEKIREKIAKGKL